MNKRLIEKSLDASQLKWIAIITMTIDHFGKMFSLDWVMPIAQATGVHPYYVDIVITLLISIGNITIYIFLWFVAEGCRYTKDIRKYILRLLLFALLSEIPFQYMICSIHMEPLSLHLGFTNVMVTLTLGVIGCYGYQVLKEKGWNMLCYGPTILLAILAYYLQTDYDWFGVVAVLVLYIVKDGKKRVMALTLLIFFLKGFYDPLLDITTYGFALEIVPIFLFTLAFSLLCVPLLAKYNGAKGTTSKFHKYLFYAYYPIHMSVLVLLYQLINH